MNTRSIASIIQVVLAVGITALLAAAPAPAYLRDFRVVPANTPTNSSSLKSGLVSIQPCGGIYFGAAAFVTPSLPNLGLTQAMPFGGVLFGAAETDDEAAGWSVSARALCATETNTAPTAGTAAPYLKAIEVVSASSSTNSSAEKTVTARCPAGKTAVSGGGGIASLGDVAFTSLQRTQGGTSWRASAREVDPTIAPWRVQARAVCANISTEAANAYYVGPVSQQSNPPLPVSSSSTKSLTRSCPTGTFVIGGGARVLGPGFETTTRDVVITRSQPGKTGLATTWVAEARETDPTSQGWTLNAYIACAPGAQPPVLE